MNKPINLLINDTKKDIIDILNMSELPISILYMIMNEINSQVRTQAEFTLNQETIKYNEELKKEEDVKISE